MKSIESREDLRGKNLNLGRTEHSIQVFQTVQWLRVMILSYLYKIYKVTDSHSSPVAREERTAQRVPDISSMQKPVLSMEETCSLSQHVIHDYGHDNVNFNIIDEVDVVETF